MRCRKQILFEEITFEDMRCRKKILFEEIMLETNSARRNDVRKVKDVRKIESKKVKGRSKNKF